MSINGSGYFVTRPTMAWAVANTMQNIVPKASCSCADTFANIAQQIPRNVIAINAPCPAS